MRSAWMPVSQTCPDAPTCISRIEQSALAGVIQDMALPIVTTGRTRRNDDFQARGADFRARLQVRGRSAVIPDWTTEPAR
jgi:hypothetical protein